MESRLGIRKRKHQENNRTAYPEADNGFGYQPALYSNQKLNAVNKIPANTFWSASNDLERRMQREGLAAQSVKDHLNTHYPVDKSFDTSNRNNVYQNNDELPPEGFKKVIVHIGNPMPKLNSIFGHAGILFDDSAYSQEGGGFYKMPKSEYLYDRNDEGKDKKEGEMNLRGSIAYTLYIPKEKAENIEKDFIEEMRKSNESIRNNNGKSTYNLLTNNCANSIARILVKHGVIPKRPYTANKEGHTPYDGEDLPMLPATLGDELTISPYFKKKTKYKKGDRMD